MADRHLVLERFLPYRLNRAAEVVSQRFAAIYRSRYGLTRPEWRTLATVGQMEPTTATAIGCHSAMHKTKVSRAVFALEGRGWLKREADAADRRVERLTLTREGRRRYEELVALALAFERDLDNLVGPEGRDSLERGLAALEELSADAPRP